MSYEELLELTDEELCRAAASGVREAENVLAERYLYLVRAAARPYFLAGGDSEDLTQEGMLGLLSAIREYDPDRGSFSAFASRCVKNRLISSTRAAGREKHAPLNGYVELASAEIDPEPGDISDPEQQLLERESYRETLAKLESLLSTLENRVLRLYLDGRTTAEIASALAREPKSVENAINRIRRKLAAHFPTA